jgi:ABC-2 type transport system permease protein
MSGACGANRRALTTLHAEWTKLRTLAGTKWLLLGVIVTTVGLSAVASAAVAAAQPGLDAAKVSLTGVAFGQAVVAVLAVLAVGSEYGSGMIHLTFTAMPRRILVLAAKAAVVSGPVLLAAAAAVLGSLLAGGFHYTSLSIADGPVLRAAVGSMLYLVLIGLLSVGIAFLVRDSALAIGMVLGLVYLFPIVAQVVGNPDWYRHLQQIAPMTAGLAVQTTVNVAAQPIAPWAGLGVLSAWAFGALLLGGVVVRLRDA